MVRKSRQKVIRQGEQWKCGVCRKRFSTAWRLRLHMQKYPSQAFPAYICPLCDTKFAFASMFRNHLLLVHSVLNMERPYRCDIESSSCKRTFSRVLCLNAHKIVHHGVQSPYVCKKCTKICYTKSHLRKHYKYHLSDKTRLFSCTTCGRKLCTPSDLQWHEFCHTLPKNIQCKYCERNFASGDLAEMHTSTQHDNSDGKNFVCPTCGKRYKMKKALLIHLETCKTEMKCATCGKSDFPNRRTFLNHELNHILVACNVCGKLYGKGPQLQWHKKYCKPEAEKSLCPLCGIRVSQLNHHMRRVHEQSKSGTKSEIFKCPVCSKVCSQKHHLKEHMEIHSDKRERNFMCDICGKGFYYKKNLVYHATVHKQKEGMRCSFCGKVLFSQAGLKCHLRLHTGEKRYKCVFCLKAFPTSSGLKYHERRGKCNVLGTSATV